ncbi:hypothetical protein LTR84_007613 [Exophiala bonariae]|uniref:Zn(2)-C6 fungal-type domain-containing protein n=1 Tax=Exophiala bonariae TaxID=1690606 RepID=A0AAV9NL01_9EURO|nr:hypothetical protein LTR84_007613 [Exophiala bonariae]
MNQPSQKRRGDAPNKAEPPPSKRTMVRKRATLACEECRTRKRRCDSAFPACGGCKKRKSDCVYSAEIEAKQWNFSMIRSLRAHLEELEKEAEILPNGQEKDVSHIRNVPRPQQPSQQPLRLTQLDDNCSDATPTVIHSQAQLSDPSGHGASSRCIEPYGFEQLIPPIDLPIDQRADTCVRSALLFDSIGSPQVGTPPDDNNNDDNADCKCDRALDAMQCRLPLRRHADSLVAIFFSRHQRMLPVLHEPTFMKQYHALWESTYTTSLKNTRKLPSCLGLCKQKSKGTLFPSTLNVVLSLASLFASRDSQHNAEQAQEYFRLAESIDIFRILDEEVGIELVQLALLMGFYLQSTERFSKCWNIGGLAIRMAQNMGLHFSIPEARRRGLLPSFSTQLDCEMRVRVWYGCVILETDISISFGQPLLVSTSRKLFKLPEPIDDQLLSDKVGKPNAQPKDLHSFMEYYTETIKLYRILGRVLEEQEQELISDSSSTTQSILGLDAKIMEWQSNLPPYLKQEPLPAAMDFCGDHISEFLLPESLGMLDFPALARRLHCRFLHTRILILKPALELLFQKQQRQKPDVVFGLSKKGIIQDSLVRSTAAQCVLLAIDLL